MLQLQKYCLNDIKSIWNPFMSNISTRCCEYNWQYSSFGSSFYSDSLMTAAKPAVSCLIYLKVLCFISFGTKSGHIFWFLLKTASLSGWAGFLKS